MANQRVERLQVMLTEGELSALDDWRFSHRMPSRAAAIRELLKRGLAAEGFDLSEASSRSKDYGVTAAASKRPRRQAGNGAKAPSPREKNG
jgi:hypothetical protein